MLIIKGSPPQKIGKAQSVHDIQHDSRIIKLNPILTLKTEGCIDSTLNQIYCNITDNENITGKQFKQLLVYLDTKFGELSNKMENLDGLSDINNHLLKIQSSQVSPIGKLKNDDSPTEIIRNKSTGSLLQHETSSQSEKGKLSARKNQKSQFASQNSMDVNRLNIFEKKIRVVEEKINLLEQEQQEKLQSQVNKLERKILNLSDKFQSSQYSDFFRTSTEFGENQKQLMQHVQSFEQEIIDLNKKILKLQKDLQDQINSFKLTLDLTSSECTQNSQKTENLYTNIQELDSDFLLIMKCYKDILSNMFRIEIIEQQTKRIMQLILM